ncbi:hypothetical protein MRX96_011368 [Rhipicephalus microplus]
MDSFHRRTDISSDKRHQRAVLPSQRYESISLPVRQRRVYGHPSTKRRNWIDDKIIDGCLYEELAESGAFSGRVNSATMQFTNPFCFVVQVTAWIHFTAVPIFPVISDTHGLSCHLNDMKVSACPCDRDVSTVFPLPNEGIGWTTKSSTAAYMKNWRNPAPLVGV